MIAPVATLRTTALKLDSNTAGRNSFIGGNNSSIGQSQPRRSELAAAVSIVLNEGDDELDNRQKLDQLNALLTNATADDLSTMVDALPDSAIKQWIKEIQKDTVPNSGLTADQRQAFFSLLGQHLTPAQAHRWQSALPESLKEEFALAMAKCNDDNQNLSGFSVYSSSSDQDSLFLLGNSVEARSRQTALSQEPAVHTPLTENANREQHVSERGFSPADNIDATLANWDGAENADTITRAIKALNPDGTDRQNKQLVYQYLDLQRSIQIAQINPEIESDVLTNLLQTHRLLEDAGISSASALPANLKIRFTSSSLPPELGHLKSRGTSDDRKFGEPGWYNTVSVSAFPPTLLIRYAIEQPGVAD